MSSYWKAFWKDARTFGVVDTIRSAMNLLATIEDPSRSNIKQGINRLIREHDAAAAGGQPPEIEALFAERYDPEIDVSALAQLPAGTLGREFARFLADHEITQLSYLLDDHPSWNVDQYAIVRAYKMHDVLHVVLGCAPTVEGEVEIVAFSWGQDPAAKASALALAVLLMHVALKRPADVEGLLHTAAAWIELGRRCRNYVGFRFEDHWARPVGEVRRAYFGDVQPLRAAS
jgi:ubiquinone biosynthesis protein COQ4